MMGEVVVWGVGMRDLQFGVRVWHAVQVLVDKAFPMIMQ
jgi:hypothetical protein